MVRLDSKVHNFGCSLFLLLIIIRFGRLAEIKRSVYYYDYYCTFCEFFIPVSVVSWCSFTGVWVTANVLGSLELFSVFKLILTVLWSGWSRLFLSFNSSNLFFCSFFRAFEDRSKCTNKNYYYRHHCIFSSDKVQIFVNLFAFLNFYSVVHWDAKIHNFFFVFFMSIKIWSGLLAGIRCSFSNPREFLGSNSLGRIQVCAFIIC